MAYGLTETGFVPKKLDEIYTSISENLVGELGAVKTSGDSVFGQIIGNVAEPLAELWEQLGNVYEANYPATAYGVNLDNTLTYNGLTRIPATAASLTQLVIADEGKYPTISTSFQVSSESGLVFTNTAEFIIELSSCGYAVFEVPTVGDGSTSGLTIDATSYSLTFISGESSASFFTRLAEVINTTQPSTGTSFTASVSDGDLIVEVDDESIKNVSIGLLGIIVDKQVGTFGSFLAEETGFVSIAIGGITTIETSVQYVESTTNIAAVGSGTDREEDDESRVRRYSSLKKLGNATVESIRSNLLNNVSGVSSVFVFENTTKETVDSVPPNSIHVIILGGDDDEIAAELWRVKPGGITFYGSVDVSIIDSIGGTQIMRFSRVTSSYCWVNLVLTLSTETTFSSNGTTEILANILELQDDVTIGKDIIKQSFINPALKVGGLTKVEVTIGVTSSPTGTPTMVSDDFISIDPTSFYELAASRVGISFT